MEKKILYEEVDGVRIPKGFDVETFRSALKYKAKPGELYIATYPKCGTTWMQYIVLLILRKGQLSEDPLDFFLGCPFLELLGGDYVEKSKPRVMKTHLPYDCIPYSDDAKYIYVARNPWDCCVSFYYHMKLFLVSEELDFDKFFDNFLEDNLAYRDYFDHLLEWYQHRNDKNVYFVTYERLKDDIRGEILKIAKFMGEEYLKCIEEDPSMLDNIIRYSSFDYMKTDINKIMEMFIKKDQLFQSENLPSGMKKAMELINTDSKSKVTGSFVRKGVKGDWKNHFNEDQIRLLKEKIAKKTEGSDVMELWKDM